MYVWPSVFGLCLCFLSIKRISSEKCETTMHKETTTIIRIRNETTEMCGFNSAKFRYNVTDNNSGEVNFSIIFDKFLCVGNYTFEVSNKNGTHSRHKFSICTHNCSANYTDGFILIANVSVNFVVNFSTIYIFTGSYNLTIKNENGLKIWNSTLFNLTTKYTYKKLEDIIKPVDAICFQTQKNTLKAAVNLNSTVFLKPPPLKIFVVPRDSLSESIDSFCHGNYKHICSSFTGYKHSCDYQFEVTSGEYVMYVIIDDLRCNNETLWTNKSALCVYSGTCTVKEVLLQTPTAGAAQKIIIGSVVLTAIVASIIFFLVKRCCKRIETQRNRNSYKVKYSRQPTDEKYEYLIIHARELEQFEKMVDALKQLLACGTSRVTTLYELDPRCVDPKKWLQNKLRADKVKVILLLNIASAYACDKRYVYRMSHCFDSLFPYTIQLLQSYEQRSYHNLYKVLSPETNPEEFRFINTLTVYYLPQHTTDLVTELQITSPETQERIEVLINECCQYRDCIISNQQYLHDIFVKKFINK